MARVKTNLMSFAVRRTELNRYSKLISAEWQKATASIIAVSKHCAEANERLSVEEKQELFNQLPFGQSVFSKLAKIGSDSRLSKPSVMKILPPNYSTIYEVTHLSDSKLQQAIKKQIIHPKISRAEIVSFVKGVSLKVSKKDKSVADQKYFFAEIRLPRDIDRSDLFKADKLVHQIEAISGVEIIRSTDTAEYSRLVDRASLAQSKYHVDVQKNLRTLVQKRINTLKKNMSRKNWNKSFYEEEVSMKVPLNELSDKIKQVLATLGFEGDYDDMLKQAQAMTSTAKLNEIEKELDERFINADIFSFSPENDAKITSSTNRRSNKERFKQLKVY